MPLYLFDGPDGETIEERVSGTPADIITIAGKVFRRRLVQPFSITGLRPAPSLGDQILRGYKMEELRNASQWRPRLPAAEIKNAWKDDKTEVSDAAHQ